MLNKLAIKQMEEEMQVPTKIKNRAEEIMVLLTPVMNAYYKKHPYVSVEDVPAQPPVKIPHSILVRLRFFMEDLEDDSIME